MVFYLAHNRDHRFHGKLHTKGAGCGKNNPNTLSGDNICRPAFNLLSGMAVVLLLTNSITSPSNFRFGILLPQLNLNTHIPIFN
jgi:hypothetical protein